MNRITQQMNKDHQGRPFELPWCKWLKRRTVLKRQEYKATQRSMCVMIRQNAAKFNLPVSVSPRDDGSILIIPRTKTSKKKRK